MRNGTIVGWDKGLALHGEAIVVGVRIYGANYSCIELNYDSQVIDSMAVGCGHHGIVVGSGSLVRGCVANGNVFEIGTGPTAGPWANFCKGTGCPP